MFCDGNPRKFSDPVVVVRFALPERVMVFDPMAEMVTAPVVGIPAPKTRIPSCKPSVDGSVTVELPEVRIAEPFTELRNVPDGKVKVRAAAPVPLVAVALADKITLFVPDTALITVFAGMPAPVTVIPGSRFAVPPGTVTVALLNVVVAPAFLTTAGNVITPEANVVLPSPFVLAARFKMPAPERTN